MTEKAFVKEPYVAWKLALVRDFAVIGIIWGWACFLPAFLAPILAVGTVMLLLALLTAPAIVAKQPYLEDPISSGVAFINGVLLIAFIGIAAFTSGAEYARYALVAFGVVALASYAACAWLICPRKYEVTPRQAAVGAFLQATTLAALIAAGPYGAIGIAAIIIGGLLYARRVRQAASAR